MFSVSGHAGSGLLDGLNPMNTNLKKPPFCTEVSCWCQGAELNRRHCDFQSHALPTELPWRDRNCCLRGSRVADRTGFEPATTRVTGGYANRCTTGPDDLPQEALDCKPGFGGCQDKPVPLTSGFKPKFRHASRAAPNRSEKRHPRQPPGSRSSSPRESGWCWPRPVRVLLLSCCCRPRA